MRYRQIASVFIIAVGISDLAIFQVEAFRVPIYRFLER